MTRFFDDGNGSYVAVETLGEMDLPDDIAALKEIDAKGVAKIEKAIDKQIDKAQAEGRKEKQRVRAARAALAEKLGLTSDELALLK